ncbi:MAG: class I SAM-dependent DNA methyltransferase [Treponema sp.]|nr:type I restriction-modification system subunit M [Spirochaetia bacterium]MDD7458688.1 class I SAM-dependent DNA methyltransferase [Spirochaetales bacterium]MDY5812121.1 class I SAM-dependent DNA methyltransferase [Treponema sp.]
MAENIIIDDTPVDVTAEVNFIWSIANKLRGTYQSDKYKEVIIPMTIIRRFECALEETKDKVIARAEEDEKTGDETPDLVYQKIAGYQFYNKSKYTLKELCNDSPKIKTNFESYIEGFSANAQDIISNLEFKKQIEKMDANNRLFSVVQAFSQIDLSPKTIDNIKMGYIFEELIRKFSENAEAGDHYTGRDIIKCMVSILLSEGCDDLKEPQKEITILDQACGTGGMLSTSCNFLSAFNPTAKIRLYGQEINPESYAMCMAEMLIRGQDVTHICKMDTMKKDCFPNKKMRFVIENPPFGTAWGGKDAAEGVEHAVLEEAKKKDGRFPAGTPGSGDMQLLFMQSAVDKINDDNGRAAIIENGSPLFSGGTSSGESQIRRYLLENDLIEAIIALPTDLFYNTGIATYIWVLSKNKRKERKGKVQLIDASSICHKLRKALGNKSNEITKEDREQITKLYNDFKPGELVKIFDNEDFMYREYSVMQPLQRSYAFSQERIEKMLSKDTLKSIYNEAKVLELESKEDQDEKDLEEIEKENKKKPLYDKILNALTDAQKKYGSKKWLAPEEFEPVLEDALKECSLERKTFEKIMTGLSAMDKEAVIQKDKKGEILYDPETKDTEIVTYKENIDDYMAREVLPHIPDAKAFFEENLAAKKPVIKTGAEIPFTRHFYKYLKPRSSKDLACEFNELEKTVSQDIKELFGE